MKETIPGIRAVAQRAVNAENEFLGWIEEQGFTSEEAEIIFGVYRSEKIIKLQVSMGRYTIKHGAFTELEVLHRALEMGRA